MAQEQPGKKEDVIYVGHGNQLPSTATYAMLDYMMKAHGLKNFHVSTIEGYPTLDATLAQLKETRPKQVTLIPLLLVCGNHTKEDIVGVWKPEMEKQVIRPMSVCRDWANNPLSGNYIWNTLRRC